MLDLVRPSVPGRVSLADLKRCRLTPIFFDTFFNMEKYLDHEQRDPFASRSDDADGMAMSDWDRYAAEEYEILVAEESAQNAAMAQAAAAATRTLDFTGEPTQSAGTTPIGVVPDFTIAAKKFGLRQPVHLNDDDDEEEDDYDYAETDYAY